jgi:hypothetical protein
MKAVCRCPSSSPRSAPNLSLKLFIILIPACRYFGLILILYE